MALLTRLRNRLLTLLTGPENTCGLRNRTDRERWLEQALAQVPANSRILDAGAGELKYKPLCAHLNYVSQDFGQYNGQGDGAGLQTGTWDQTRLDIVCDITAIPEPDASFDAIMCIEVLEHLPDPVAALREFRRLLREDGTLILTAPFCSLTHFAPYHFSTGFNRYFYEKWLTENGFEIADLQANGNYFEYMGQELRRVESMATKYGSMPPASGLARFLRELATRHLLRHLADCSARDTGSAELLNFGLHVRAIKRGES